MALTLGDNFSYQGAKPLDARLKYATVADMKAVADSTIYDGCLAYCTATDKTYQWKSTNTVDTTLGKWREFSSVVVDDAISSSSENPVQNKVIKGALDGKADLVDGKIPASQLPSYVDDVIDGYYKTADGKFYEESTYETEITPESGKIYISVDTEIQYRWTGSAYSPLGGALTLGETSSTAYRGDRGKAAYDISQTVGDVANLQTTAKNSVVAAINEVAGSVGVQLGETSTTAYRGDRGKEAYDVSQTVGSVSSLTTTDKSSVVGAVNEVNGKVQIIQYSALPTASADNLGQIIQYTGATGQNLTNGFFYECVANGSSYTWTEIGVQQSGNTPVMRGATNYTDGESGLAPKPYTTDVGKALFADGKYHNIYSAASGSTILAVTTDTSLYGRTVTLTDGTHTATQTMGNDGECYFTDVQMFGNVTLSCTDAQSNEARASLNLTYFGTYQCNLTLNYATLHFTSTDLNMVGEELVVYYDGTQVATTSLRSSGGVLSADVYVEELGTYTVKMKNSSKGMADASVTVSALQHTYTVPLFIYHLYGVEWDGSASTVLSRTDLARDFTNPVPYVAGASVYSSPFDDIAPWSGVVRVTNVDAGELVKIPKFWYKLDTSSGFKLQIADKALDGFSVAPAFMDRGDGKGERPYAYVGRYHCSSSNYKSATGVTPKGNETRATFRSGIHGLGNDIWQWDYAMLITIQMLYLVEFANWNVQATIGAGCSQTTSTSSAVFNCGGTDSMPYHTGTVSANHTDYGDCQYRYMENLWGNVFDFCDGIYFSDTDIYVIKNPANFSDTTGGTKVGTRPNSSGYISALAKSAVTGFDWFYYPSAVAGSDSTYIPDYCGYSASGVVLYAGGFYSQSPDYGLFCLSGSNTATNKNDYRGSRLQYLP